MNSQYTIDSYIKLLSTIEQNEINVVKMGVIESSCNGLLFSILVHCVENIELFNDTQLQNINMYINKILYGN